MRKIFKAPLVIQIAALCGSLGGCAVRPSIPVGEIPPATRPAPNDLAVTRGMVHSQFEGAGYKVYESGADYQRVKRIVDRLGRAAGATDFTYPVVIADAGKEVNAMAVRDNTMVVFKELLRKVPEDDQLATVLAHEVAHMLAHHGADQTSVQRAAWVSMGSSVLGSMTSMGVSQAGVDPTLANVAGSAAETTGNMVGTGVAVRSYDRKIEYEADQVGLMLMAKAGYNPLAAIQFWERAPEIFGGDTGGVFLSTHPSSGNRVERLQEALPVAQQYYVHWKDLEEMTPAPSPSGKKKKKGKLVADDEEPRPAPPAK